MIKSEELKNPNGCLGKASDDEPLFVLRANDELAPGVVRLWAESYRAKHQGNETFTDERKAKYEEALDLADQMEAWKKQQP